MDRLKQVCVALFTAMVVLVLFAGCSADAKKARHLERADGYFKSGDYEKAKIEYLNVLRLEPLNPRAIRQTGFMLHEQGAPISAYRFLLKATEQNPQDAEISIKLGFTQVALGEVKKAQEVATAVLAKDPTNEEALLLLADAAVAPELIAITAQWLEQVRAKAGKKAVFHLALAQVALRKKDLAGAEASLRQAVTLEPKSSLARMAMGDWYRAKTNLAQAELEFKAAMDAAPLRSPAPLKYAELKANAGGADEARKILNEVTKKTPDYLPAWGLLAQLAFAEKKYDECITISERILNADQANFRSRQLLAQAKMAKGQTAQAIQELESLNTLFPKSPQARFQLAVAYLQTTNIDRAGAALEQAISLNTNFTEAIVLQARLKLSKGDAAGVVSSMLSLVKRQPDAKAAYVLLADGYRMLRRPDDAIAVLRGLAKSSPQDSQPPFLLGMMLREQGKNPEARGYFESALALAPDNLPILYQLVDLDILNKNYQAPLTRLQAEIQRRPASGGLRFLEARVYRAQGDLARAEESLKKTLELDPNFVSAYQLLATTYVSGQKLGKATEQLESLLSNKPRDISSLMLLGTIYEHAKDFDKARDTYEKLLTVNSQFVPALNNLAYLYAERFGNLQKGHDLARKARTLDQEDSRGYVADTLGWILYKRKDYQEAMMLLQESASKSASMPEIQYHLGMAHYMMGQTEPAKLAFQRALSSPDSFQGKDEAQRHLTLLGVAASPAGGGSVAELEAVLKANPDDILTRLRLAELHEQQGAPGKAAKRYEEILQINPQSASAMVKLARLNAGPLRDRDKAMTLVKRARELSPNDPEAAQLLGKLVFQAGDHAYAYSLLRETSARQTTDAELYYDLGWAAYSVGLIPEANQAVQRSLSIAPQNPQADAAKWFLMMTAVSEASKDLPQTEPRVKELLKADPAHAPALMALGQIHLQRGENSQAIDAFEKALARFPKLAPAQKYLAALYAQTPGKEAKAYELATSARAVLRNDPGLAKTLGRLSYGRKDYRYAVTLFEEGLRGGPQDAPSLFLLGMSHYQLKDADAGAAVLQKALAAGLAEPSAAEARRVLGELQKR